MYIGDHSSILRSVSNSSQMPMANEHRWRSLSDAKVKVANDVHWRSLSDTEITVQLFTNANGQRTPFANSRLRWPTVSIGDHSLILRLVFNSLQMPWPTDTVGDHSPIPKSISKGISNAIIHNM
ncbi:hypothetical protein LWI28_014487 [Acer negundo]|uniref:Uncharacterized protein n=1 Tax=Acer negundo TaxID=4023 RepID=A0AAD5IU71_ACENE|nr:hypothetical protein LWI28_014487 [Acer negundo]